MPRGSSLGERAVRTYLGHHVNRLFAGSHEVQKLPPMTVTPLKSPPSIIARCARRIAQSERPVLVVGSQTLVEAGNAHAVAAAIERIGMPVYLSGMARGLLGSAHPLHRRHQRRKTLREADLVVLAGVPSDFRLDYGRNIQRSVCLISANRSRIDLKRNRRPNIGALCDAGQFLQALAEKLDPSAHKRWGKWQATLLKRDEKREQEIEANAAHTGALINPVAFCKAIDAQLPDNCIIVADGGDFVGTASYIVRPRKRLAWLDPGVFGTLGCGAGFSLGASLCFPDHQVWALFGDGSVGYALAEFDTFVRHKVPVLAVVGNNASWAQIAREQVKILGDDVGTVLARSNYHEVALALGGRGVLLQQANQTVVRLQEAQRAIEEGLPVLVNAWLEQTDFREGSLSM